MNVNQKIKIILSILFFTGIVSSVFSQTAMLAYNVGLANVYVSSGVNVTIQGGFASLSNSGVDGWIDNDGIINVSGDFVNNNTASEAFLNTGAGLVNLNGTTAGQTIGGTFTPGFYDLTLNNTFGTSPQITLSINTTVKDILSMNSGNINLSSHTLTLGTSSASPGTLSYSTGMLYAGTFTRWFNTTSFSIANVSGLFPMGTYLSDYRPLWIAYSSNLSTGGTVSVIHNPVYSAGTNPTSYTDASWAGGTTVVAISNSSWVVSSANGFASSGSNLSMRLGGGGITAFLLSDVNLSLSASTVGTFSAATNAVVPLEVNRTALSTANLSNTFYIGTRNVGTSPLPVELLTFNAIPNGTVVDVNWTTASEQNSDYFSVQRSQDGNSFTDVVQVKASGNSSVLKKYSAIDYEPYNGVSYYRLKQVDLNGNFIYSELVAVKFQNNNSLSIYPNPSNGPFNVSISGQNGKEVLVLVRDIEGREIYAKLIVVSSDKEVVVIDLSGKLASGVYVVIATSDNTIYEKKIVIN